MAAMLASCSAEEGFTAGGEPEVADPEYQRTPPPLVLAEYVGTNQVQNADGSRSGVIDLTNVSKGYIAVQCTAPTAAILMVKKDGVDDQYTLPNDGSTSFFPLAMGDGYYTFILYLNVEGTSYEQFLVADASVTMESEFAPFLVQSVIVDYDANSACVQQSYEIAAHAASDLEVVQQIYAWIADNITYDTAKATALAGATVAYTPSPDDTLRTKTGICYDYASLAAAMLRANGIPTKLIKGDVLDQAQNSIYHAWNMVWLEETGWIAVELAVNPNDWTRIDTTFAAAGPGMGSFIGDGSNYTPMSQH